MRMRGKKPIFSRKDTWDLGHTLSPIIAAGLKKFKEVVREPDTCAGCPFDFVPNRVDVSDEELREGIVKWHEVLDKMIYAFDRKEPEIPDGVFSDESVPIEGSDLTGVRVHIDNQELYDEYKRDMEEWDRKVKEGRGLFSQHYSSLWW